MRIELYKSELVETPSKRVPSAVQPDSAANMSRRKQQKPRHLDAEEEEEELATAPNNGRSWFLYSFYRACVQC